MCGGTCSDITLPPTKHPPTHTSAHRTHPSLADIPTDRTSLIVCVRVRSWRNTCCACSQIQNACPVVYGILQKSQQSLPAFHWERTITPPPHPPLLPAPPLHLQHNTNKNCTLLYEVAITADYVACILHATRTHTHTPITATAGMAMYSVLEYFER